MLMTCVFMRFIVRRTKRFDQRARFTPPHSRSVFIGAVVLSVPSVAVLEQLLRFQCDNRCSKRHVPCSNTTLCS